MRLHKNKQGKKSNHIGTTEIKCIFSKLTNIEESKKKLEM